MALSPDDIRALMGHVNTTTEQAVKVKIEECWELIADKIPTIESWHIAVEYDLRGSTAGQAWGANKIRLNVDYLNDPETKDHILNQTLPHEFAHCIVAHIWPDAKSHGNEWAAIMRVLNIPANRTHSMPAKRARKTQKFPYQCPCGKTFMLGKNRHNKVQFLGTRYMCRICGGVLTLVED